MMKTSWNSERLAHNLSDRELREDNNNNQALEDSDPDSTPSPTEKSSTRGGPIARRSSTDDSSSSSSSSPSTLRRFLRRLRHNSLLFAFKLLVGFVVGAALHRFYLVSLRRAPRFPDPNPDSWSPLPRPPPTPAPLRLKPQPLIRPSSYDFDPCASAAPGGFLFVGVLTAEMFLSTRASAVFRTWGQDVPGRIAFFSSTSSGDGRPPDLPVVSLPGVDDSYPPQKKSFLMLKYMYDRCIDKFEWFLRADDDVHFRMDKLESFLRSIDSSKSWYIGQRGVGNTEEIGKLHLEEGENFCMGGPGMVFSRATIKLIGPNIQDCLRNNIFSYHEDVEVGRCVFKHARIPCTRNYEMRKMFYHNGSDAASYTGDLSAAEVERSISLHPVKRHQYQFWLWSHFLRLKIDDARHRTVKMKQAVEEVAAALDPRGTDDAPRRRQDEGIWDNFNKWAVCSSGTDNPRRGYTLHRRSAWQGIERRLTTIINRNAARVGRQLSIKEVRNGYSRLDILRGVDFAVEFSLVYRKFLGKKETFSTRWLARLRQSFARLEWREAEVEAGKWRGQIPDVVTPVPSSWAETLLRSVAFLRIGGGPVSRLPALEPVYFVLALAGRFLNFERFMRRFDETCLAPETAAGQRCGLTVVLFSAGDPAKDRIAETEALFAAIRRSRRPAEEMRLVFAKGDFSRGVGLEIGAAFHRDSDLLFLCDVDLVFDSGLVDRARLNAVRGKKVYYPIMYSQFDPEYVVVDSSSNHSHPPPPLSPAWRLRPNFLTDRRLGDVSGYWRQFSFGMVALYKSDLTAAGGFDLGIRGWGGEDADLCDKILQRTELEVQRVVDVSLVHVFHPIRCDKSLSRAQFGQCVDTLLSTFSSADRLAQLLLPVKDEFLFRNSTSVALIP